MLVLSRYFWPEGGGAELATHLVLRYLSKYFRMSLISGTCRPQDAKIFERILCVPSLKFSSKPKLLLGFMSYHRRAIEKMIRLNDIIYIPSSPLIPIAIFTKKISNSKSVVIHLHDYQPLSFSSIILHKERENHRTDYLVERYEHGSLLRAALVGVLEPFTLIYRESLKYSDAIITVSQRQREIIEESIPQISGRIVTIYNLPPPIPKIDEKKLDSSPSFLYIGGGSYIKGVETLLTALKKIMGKDLKIYIIRTGRANPKYERILTSLEKANPRKITVLDRMPHSKLMEMYTRMWSLLFPSIHEEPLPYAVIEAALLGTLPIASRVGGVPEIVGGTPVQELLFEPGNASELVEKIEALLTYSREDVLYIGNLLRDHIRRKFDEDVLRRKIIKVLTRLP